MFTGSSARRLSALMCSLSYAVVAVAGALWLGVAATDSLPSVPPAPSASGQPVVVLTTPGQGQQPADLAVPVAVWSLLVAVLALTAPQGARVLISRLCMSRPPARAPPRCLRC